MNNEFSLPTERFPTNPKTVGSTEGEAFVPGEGLAVLDSGWCIVVDSDIYRDMRHCVNCGGPQVFVVVYEFEGGRVGVCLGCGDERVAPFSRTTAEAA